MGKSHLWLWQGKNWPSHRRQKTMQGQLARTERMELGWTAAKGRLLRTGGGDQGTVSRPPTVVASQPRVLRVPMGRFGMRQRGVSVGLIGLVQFARAVAREALVRPLRTGSVEPRGQWVQ